MATDREDLLDIKQAAQFLNVSETSLRRWTNDGRLACYRVGRKRERRFRRDDLLSFLETQPVQGAPELQPRSVADRRDDLGSHRCGLYQSEQRGAAQAATFLGEGLLPGTVSYLVATPPARERVLAELESRGASLREDLQAGRLVLVDPAASGGGQYEYFETAFTTALRGGAGALRLVGDMTWCLERGMTPDEIVAFEAAYDRRFGHGLPIAALCLSDVRRFSTLSLLHALRGHPDTFRYPVEQWLS